MIADDIEITVLSISGDKVKVGIQAPREIPVFRTEVYLEMRHGDPSPSTRVEVDDALKRLSGEG
jgi:carbon storage regulator